MTIRTKYSGLQMSLHWMTAALIAGNYFISEGMPEALDARMNGQTIGGLVPSFHVWAGSALLVIVLLRLATRLISGAPHEHAIGWMANLANLTHWVLYGLMIAVPTLGVAAWFFGVDQAADLHVLVMNIMMILILGHAAMAIFHHYVLKDGLLGRILPIA
ncbi:MAG: cytochrome b/b6 domain-containing protein [Paracoccaceae bacterium]